MGDLLQKIQKKSLPKSRNEITAAAKARKEAETLNDWDKELLLFNTDHFKIGNLANISDPRFAFLKDKTSEEYKKFYNASFKALKPFAGNRDALAKLSNAMRDHFEKSSLNSIEAVSYDSEPYFACTNHESGMIHQKDDGTELNDALNKRLSNWTFLGKLWDFDGFEKERDKAEINTCEDIKIIKLRTMQAIVDDAAHDACELKELSAS